MKVEIDQIITQIISFLMILWILSRFAWKPFLKLLDDRKKKIQSEYSDIADQKKQAEDLTNEYKDKLKRLEVEAQEKMSEVLEQAKLHAEAIREEAHQKAKSILVQVQEDVDKEIAQARTKMKKELVDISLAATENILQQGIDADKQKEFAQKYIEQMEVH
jgi:F-type H+-transporting ATPase subunit b